MADNGRQRSTSVNSPRDFSTRTLPTSAVDRGRRLAHLEAMLICPQCQVGRTWLHQAKRICGHCGYAQQHQAPETWGEARENPAD